ncbi:MAG: DUF58 domain-containing protein [Planctomycetia bacterium]|nr:DUF58 domain-containing protein [Planctomycetia bacterium]
MSPREPGADATLFPPGFLRLLATVPALVRRVRAGAAAGVHAARGTGGPFLFRGHRAYREGDDLRRVDWGVLARHDRVVVREHDAERDVRTEVWLDGSASLAPGGGRAAAARATALACAVGLCGGGRVRLGVLRDGAAAPRREADDPADLAALLDAIAAETPAHRAGLADALPALAARLPARARLFLVTDLLTDADPALLARAAGRGLSGAVLHLRDPDTWAPPPEGLFEAVDAESGARRVVRWTPDRAERVARRAAAHAERWTHAARAAGLAVVPFAPSTPPEDLLARLALEVP